MQEEKNDVEVQNPATVLPLRDLVIYPHMVVPLFINRKKSVKALELGVTSGKQVFFTAQKNPKQDDPKFADLYSVGTLANILQVIKLPDGATKVLVEGMNRGRIINAKEEDEVLIAEVELLVDLIAEDQETEALVRSVLGRFEDYLKLNSKIPVEILSALSNVSDPGRLSDAIAAHLPLLKLEDRQKILETQHTKERLELILSFLLNELELLQVEEKVKSRVKGQLSKTQREFYLNEKIKAIQKELDELDDGKKSILSDMEKLHNRIKKAGFNKEAREKAEIEFNRLVLMPPLSAEATVSRNYLDCLLELPWRKKTKTNTDIVKAEEVLNSDHYGLEKVKERIIEYLAVQSRVKKSKGPILCLVGPPGVGKTSLGLSIARATSRRFVRVSLGGVRDEAEIRGHRRTYIGSGPGKILQKMAKAKTKNPLFMLDEVDKMAIDFRGDPASALLEVLDPEQNNAFNDHYLEVDYDLSEVMFIATANSLDIPLALLDRMEVIRLSGYTEDEKLKIALKYLIPKQVIANGLKEGEIEFNEEAILKIIRNYTREAGVRELDRSLAKICRKVVKNILKDPRVKQKAVGTEQLAEYLGVELYHFGAAEKQDQVGQVNGLAWTETGGDLLPVEVTVVPGKGKAIYTGQLGEVMQESIQAALTVVRSNSRELKIKDNFYEKYDIHVHLPDGATPKDGPSAGIGICTALVSAITKLPVRADLAMTGEITLRGEVLQIGGLKEKLLAALRGGVKTVIIPDENVKELKELPANVVNALEIKPVKWIMQVLEIALVKQPSIKTSGKSKAKKKNH